MSIAAGKRLGRYEVVAPIGAGGMGEVYRARDLELDRTVAVKILPPHVAGQSDLRARFEREARAISALNHPHICTLHDVGREGDIAFFVMELIDGESLASRLARGKLAPGQALTIGAQIAAALAAAHRRGIIHRDLKPANVMLTRSGVKLLDFGIARLTISSTQDTSNETTIAGAVTAEGTILGTLQYMAPEQLEGKPADARADLFSFGCMLYEMISGQRAFDGASQASIITAIMSSEPPPLPQLDPLTPPALERLVRKCLAKSPDDRWESAADLETELRWLAADLGAEPRAVVARKRSWLWPAAILAVAAALVAIAILAMRMRTPGDAPMARFSIPIPVAPDSGLLTRALALSPNGRHLAFAGMRDGKYGLWLRALDAEEAVLVAGTAGAAGPFWSPDSKDIAFYANGKLLRVAREGGDVQTICPTSPGALVHGAWGPDGNIVFAELTGRPGLFRVSASGGDAKLLPGTDRGDQPRAAWPTFIPGTNRVLFNFVRRGSDIHLATLALDSSDPPQILDPITSSVEVVGDRILFVRDSTLYAQRFDTSKLQRVGEPSRIAANVGYYESIGSAAFSASKHTIVVLSSVLDSRLTWFDRAGNATDVPGLERLRATPHLSRDGRKAAIVMQDERSGTTDVWIADLERGGAIRVTTWRGSDGSGVLSPDGMSVVYGSDRDGPPHIFLQSLAAASADAVTPLRGLQAPRDWTSDGALIIFDETNPTTRRDIWLVDARPSSTPRIWLQTPANEWGARLSTDRKWMTFVSNASGRDEVYVAPFERPADAVKISTSGGSRPVWRRDGTELFYMNEGGSMYRVGIRTTPAFTATMPELLFRNAEGTWDSFDVTANGDRFLMTREISGPRNRPIEAIVNW